MVDALSEINLRRTPQSEPADPRQVPNNAGGFTFTVPAEARLHRFLTLGTAGGTYYASESQVTKDNAGAVLDWARDRAGDLVSRVIAVSESGAAPRNNPALFALAAAASLGDADGRALALNALPKVARTSSHLFTFAGYLEQFRGWGPAVRRAVSAWYTDRPVGDLAYQAAKYRQRDGWTHRDLLRLAHPKTTEPARRELFDWICGRNADLAELPLIEAFQRAQAATTPADWITLINAGAAVTWEMLPDAALTAPNVWRALLDQDRVPQTALLRQLPRLTRLGVLAPMSSYTSKAAAQLTDADRLAKARVHPVNVLVALRTYASGQSARGTTSWQPTAGIIDALDAAFYAAYGAVKPSGKRTWLALDVSGSMTQAVSGLPLTCREASAAMALVTAATEPAHQIIAFSDGGAANTNTPAVVGMAISPRQRLDDVLNTVNRMPFAGTDCALPMMAAIKTGAEVDTFIVYTDNETNGRSMHPHQALGVYRRETGINARLVVVGMTGTEFSIADPTDAGMLDVSGFDSAAPGLIGDFSAGRI